MIRKYVEFAFFVCFFKSVLFLKSIGGPMKFNMICEIRPHASAKLDSIVVDIASSDM